MNTGFKQGVVFARTESEISKLKEQNELLLLELNSEKRKTFILKTRWFLLILLVISLYNLLSIKIDENNMYGDSNSFTDFIDDLDVGQQIFEKHYYYSVDGEDFVKTYTLTVSYQK